MGDVIRFPNPGRYHGPNAFLCDAVHTMQVELGDEATIEALKHHIIWIRLTAAFGTPTQEPQQ